MLQQVNLLQGDVQATSVWVDATHLSLFALGMMVLLGGITLWHTWQVSALREREALVSADLQSVQSTAASSSARARLEKEISLLEERSRAKLSELEALKNGAAPNGFAGHLHALAETPVAGLWLTELRIEGDSVLLRGHTLRADAVPDLLYRLTLKEPFVHLDLSQVSLSGAESEGVGRPLRWRFEVSTPTVEEES